MRSTQVLEWFDEGAEIVRPFENDIRIIFANKDEMILPRAIFDGLIDEGRIKLGEDRVYRKA